MKKMTRKKQVQLAMATGAVAAMMILPGAAAGLDVPASPDAAPISASQDAGEISSALDKTLFKGLGDQTVKVSSAGHAKNALFYGTAKHQESENRLAIMGVDEEGIAEAKVILHITEETLILNATTGEPVAFKDIRDNETIYAYTSPAMALSLPPQTTAQLLLVGIPADYQVPSYVEVDTVTTKEDGTVILHTDKAMNVTLTEDTAVTPYLTKNIVTKDMIRPGDRLLVWHGPVAQSYPSQTTATKAMVFAYDYQGYVSLVDGELSINGEPVKFNRLEMPRADGETYLVPLRRMAEQLGYTLDWQQESGSVTVSLNDETVYTFTMGAETVQMGEDSRYLTHALVLEGGVTYIALDDLLTLHNLKMETLF